MVHEIMPPAKLPGNRIKDGVINTALIGVDDGAIFNVLKQKMPHIVLRYLGHDFEADVAAPFQHRDHGNFIGVLAITLIPPARAAFSSPQALGRCLIMSDFASSGCFLSFMELFSMTRLDIGWVTLAKKSKFALSTYSRKSSQMLKWTEMRHRTDGKKLLKPQINTDDERFIVLKSFHLARSDKTWKGCRNHAQQPR